MYYKHNKVYFTKRLEITNFIEQFLEMLLSERGLSKNSAVAYKRDLEDFESFIKKILRNLEKMYNSIHFDKIALWIIIYDTRHIEITIPPPVATYKEEPTVLCSVCYDASITLLLEPCSHICMCHVCYESLVKKECPICKTAISATRKIYFATPGGK